jgi:hypothetical protein
VGIYPASKASERGKASSGFAGEGGDVSPYNDFIWGMNQSYVKRNREIQRIKKKKGKEETETKNKNKRSKENSCGACQKNKI